MRIPVLLIAAILLLVACTESQQRVSETPTAAPSTTTVNRDCEFLLDTDFQTVRDVVMGEAPGGGLGYGRGSLVFDAVQATWSSSDVMMIADYACTDGVLAGQWRHLDFVGTVLTADDGEITVYWDGEVYEPVGNPTD